MAINSRPLIVKVLEIKVGEDIAVCVGLCARQRPRSLPGLLGRTRGLGGGGRRGGRRTWPLLALCDRHLVSILVIVIVIIQPRLAAAQLGQPPGRLPRGTVVVVKAAIALVARAGQLVVLRVTLLVRPGLDGKQLAALLLHSDPLCVEACQGTLASAREAQLPLADLGRILWCMVQARAALQNELGALLQLVRELFESFAKVCKLGVRAEGVEVAQERLGNLGEAARVRGLREVVQRQLEDLGDDGILEVAGVHVGLGHLEQVGDVEQPRRRRGGPLPHLGAVERLEDVRAQRNQHARAAGDLEQRAQGVDAQRHVADGTGEAQQAQADLHDREHQLAHAGRRVRRDAVRDDLGPQFDAEDKLPVQHVRDALLGRVHQRGPQRHRKLADSPERGDVPRIRVQQVEGGD
eukprot:m.67099 g.67099  ORF g.67099 m.67099 type:complete len:408 (+) comp7441_c2_seq2:103-1326(+)